MRARQLDLAVATVALLTLAALLIRLPQLGDSLFGDETYTFAEVNDRTLAEVIELRKRELPPLYFVLAWAGIKLGDPTVLVRLPSLVLGTATVPLVYLLGRLTAGKWQGVVAAALMTFSPFAIFYGTEARPYATLMFLVTLSTLLLLLASERSGWGLWVLYALTGSALLYTHYFALFALLGQAAWAAWALRERLGTVAIVYVGIAASYVPWLPIVAGGSRGSPDALAAFKPLKLETIGDELLRILPGHPNFTVGELPGRGITYGVALCIAAAAVATFISRRGGRIPRPSRSILLLILVTVAIPIGFLAYSITGPELFIARYMAGALPTLAVLVGAALLAPPRAVAIPLAVAMVACIAAGGLATLDEANRRPGFKAAAHYIDRVARESDVVVESAFTFGTRESQLGSRGRQTSLALSFEKDHDTSRNSRLAFRKPPPRGRVLVVGTEHGEFLQLPRPNPKDQLCLLSEESFSGGEAPVLVRTYVPLSPGGGGRTTLMGSAGREVVALPSGGEIPLTAKGIEGFVDRISATGDKLSAVAWALSPSKQAPASCVLLFHDRELVASAAATIPRDDLAKSFGAWALRAGFLLRAEGLGHGEPARRSAFRGVAVEAGQGADLRVLRCC